MFKATLTSRIARQSGVTKAEAADQLERVVHEIVTNLRKGRPAELPGLGKFQPGKTWSFEFQENKGDSSAGK